MGPRAALSAAALALTLGSCGLFSRASSDYSPRPGPYDQLRAVSTAQLEEVRRLRDGGDLETAHAYIALLVEREPDNVPLGRLAQDVGLELGGAEAHAELLVRAREAALLGPSVPTLLLAARLEPDPQAARRDLEDALELEADSAWVHYALAHHLAREGEWPEAARRLDHALLLDPGHLWARRLESLFLARSGGRDEAIEALRRWIRAAQDNPLFSTRELNDARLDLAQLYVLEERADDARAELEQIAAHETGDAAARARRHALLAAVEQAEGRPRFALASALQAQVEAPDEPLPLVQQAILQEEWLGDPLAARAAWQRVLDAARGRGDLGAVLLTLRARAALERLDAADPAGVAP